MPTKKQAIKDLEQKKKNPRKNIEEIAKKLGDIWEYYNWQTGNKESIERIAKSRLFNIRCEMIDLCSLDILLPRRPVYKKTHPIEHTLRSFYDWCIETIHFLDHRQKDESQPASDGKVGDLNMPQGKDGQDKKPKLEPLPENAAAVYELLKALPKHRGLIGREILEKLEHREKPIIIDQSTLTKNIIPALRPYGVKNKRGAGYFIRK